MIKRVGKKFRKRLRVKSLIGNGLIHLGKKIVGVGKNYEAHAIEMGATAAPKDPVLFLKPTSSYIRKGETILLPPEIGEVHHEVELGVVIGKPGYQIAQEKWDAHVAGYVLAIDMTARKLQRDAKDGGLPWMKAKSYNTFCPISDFIPKKKVPNWDDLELWLKVDNELRQQCSTAEMVHKLPFLISHISNIMTLEEGDMIITGTPSGVGPVYPNQTITAGIKGLVNVSFPVQSR